MKKLFLTTVLALSGSAFAAESVNSQYQHQTPVDKIEVTPALGYQKAKFKFKGGASSETTGLSESVRGEYGLTDMFSAGLDLAMSSLKTEPSTGASTTQSGMHDPNVFFHGRMPIGPGSLRFGADVAFALGKDETETNGDTNNSSGGIGLAPFVGYEMGAGSCTMGARLTYMTYLGDRTENDKSATPAVESKLSGGETLKTAIFYEYNMQPVLLGAALEVVNESKSESKANGVTSTAVTPHSEFALNVYAPWTINDMITLLPQVTYGAYTARDTTVFDSANYWKINVGARFAF